MRCHRRRGDRIDVALVVDREVTAEILGGAIRQLVHVVGGVGPQRGDRARRGLRDLELRVCRRPVGQVGLNRGACERSGRDEQNTRHHCDDLERTPGGQVDQRPQIGRVLVEDVPLGDRDHAAGLAVGFFADPQSLVAHWHEDGRWEPSWDAQRRERGYAEWQRAVQRTL